jgi:hypothetical protein
MIGEMLKFAIRDVFDTASSKQDAGSLYCVFSFFAGGQNATGGKPSPDAPGHLGF